MNPDIALFSDKSGLDKNLIEILDFFHITHVSKLNHEDLSNISKNGIKHLAINFHEFDSLRSIESQLYDHLSTVLIYEVGTELTTARSTIDVSHNYHDICREFSGISFTPLNKSITILDQNKQDLKKLVLTHEGAPIFAFRQVGNCRVFFLSTGILDIKQKISTKLKGKDYFIQLGPIVMYIKYAFNKYFKNDESRYACIIIDDLLIKRNYGFLNYRKLLNIMDAYNFFTTIAFIPWNYKRSDSKIADLLRARRDRFSICVHGCDHTKGEFASTNPKFLASKVRLATARMIEHEKRTGLSFERIMVFPQGKFSIQSMESLKKYRYEGAVNTESIAVNGDISLNISDYLKCKIMKYANFPLFLRNNPEEVLDFAFDLFFGKPALIVLHHDYLKNGYERLIELVNKINACSQKIKWDSIGYIVRNFIPINEFSYDLDNTELGGLNISSFKENIKIFMRRYASEIRDNYLMKSDFFMNVVRKLLKYKKN
jgi:hypothetical protein